MQPHVFGNTTVVGVEVLVVPLEGTARRTLFVAPVVVDPHGDDVVAPVIDIWGEVEAYGGNAVFVQTEMLSVEIEIGALTHPFELDEYFFSFGR